MQYNKKVFRDHGVEVFKQVLQPPSL